MLFKGCCPFKNYCNLIVNCHVVNNFLGPNVNNNLYYSIDIFNKLNFTNMFAKAYELASKYTLPVINSLRFYDGTVSCGLGSFIIINDNGWILTVAHLLQSILKGDQDIAELKKIEAEISTIQNNPTLFAEQKRKKIRDLKRKINPKWITNHSMWWGSDEIKIETFHFHHEIDLAIGQIKNFNPQKMELYPSFKNPKSLPIGTSLCKLGFPFHEIKATFDNNTNAFKLDPGVLPVPRFPIEGIFTREARGGKTKDNKYDIKFIETSTPGLRGQSGGPVFDKDGNVWAIQSRTNHLALGFEPKIKKQGKEVTEIQFLNVGIAVHIESIIQFLDSFNISYNLSEN